MTAKPKFSDAVEPSATAIDVTGIHRLAIPTPFMVGRVNAYLVEDDPLTLLDPGPNSGKAYDELERALRERGHRIEDLGLIVVSHQHLDHIGLVDILARRSGADVAALDALSPWLADYSGSMDAEDEFAAGLMRRHGIAEDVGHALRAVSLAYRAWGSSAKVSLPLLDGDEIALRDRTLHVHHRPGHSPSDIVLHERRQEVLLSADHLIKDFASNPLIARPLVRGGDCERPHALLAYRASLRATRAMERVRVMMPGHGDPIHDHVELIESRFRLHDRRADRIRSLVERRPLTAHEIAQEMWGNVALTQAYLTLCEVLGHLDLLVERGDVVERDEVGVSRFGVA